MDAKNQWDQTFDAIPDLIAIIDREFNIERVNRAMAECLNIQADDFVGKKCFKLMHGLDCPPDFCPCKKVFADGKERTAEIHEDYLGGDFLISVSPRFDEKGAIIGAVHVVRDITSQKENQKALAESELKFKTIFENAGGAIFIADTQTGFILDCNSEAEKLTGYSKEDIVGMHQSQLHPDDQSEMYGEKFHRDVHHGGYFDLHVQIRHKNGKIIPAWLSAQVMEIKNKQIIVGLFVDITKQKKIEEALKKAHEKLEERVSQRTEALANANKKLENEIHERKKDEEQLLCYQQQLRTLASELSLAEEHLRRNIATNIHDYIGQNLAALKLKLGLLRKSVTSSTVHQAIDEMHNLLSDTITKTRSLTFELGSPVLYELGFEKAIEWLIGQARKQYGFETVFNDDKQVKPLDDNVRVFLFQAVRELLFNIVKHANAKNASILIRKVDSQIKITVKDDGIGFDPAEINYADATRYSLGLFNIKERLGHIGGKVDINSVPGGGTNITLTAPLSSEKME